jgi:hypothetical protein
MTDITRDPYGNPLHTRTRDAHDVMLRENVWLTAELRTAADMNAVYEGRLQEKEAEVERLRAALGEIHAISGTNNRVAQLARAALKEDRT